jgi:hypothetical protein
VTGKVAADASTRIPTVRIEEHGITGYCMDPERRHDCLRPAIATVLQVPVDQVPDPDIDRRLADDLTDARRRYPADAAERLWAISRAAIRTQLAGWQLIDEWLDRRAYRVTVHETMPTLDRWIAVVEPPIPEGFFGDHCLVMSHDTLIFDPAVSVPPPPGMRLRRWSHRDFRYGLSFSRAERTHP